MQQIKQQSQQYSEETTIETVSVTPVVTDLDPLFQWRFTLDFLPEGRNRLRIVLQYNQHQYTLLSDPFLLESDSTIIALFPPPIRKSVDGDANGIGLVSISYNDGLTVIPNAAGVQCVQRPGAQIYKLVQTEIQPLWIIGARDIALIDDADPVVCG